MEDVILTLLQVAGILLVVWSLWWVSQDAERRGKAGWLVALLAFFTWPVGLLFWLVARPNVKEPGPSQFPTAIDCPKCGMTIPAGRSECPNCHFQSMDL